MAASISIAGLITAASLAQLCCTITTCSWHSQEGYPCSGMPAMQHPHIVGSLKGLRIGASR